MAKVEIVKQDLFDESNKVIGHGCNTFGKMSAGIAAMFRKLYKENYVFYLEACIDKTFVPGGVLVVEENGRTILNIASQDYPGPHARIKWIKEGLEKINEAGYRSIALPWIGCGIGGLEKEDVLKILEESPLEHIKVCEIG